MQLYILDKNPVFSANKLILAMGYKYSFKMLIELGQLICSAGYSDAYKPIPQGKVFQEWIKKHDIWTWGYFNKLIHSMAFSGMDIKDETYARLYKIRRDLEERLSGELEIHEAPFRYAKEYKSDIPTDTILNIDECIREYYKYIDWKNSKIGAR